MAHCQVTRQGNVCKLQGRCGPLFLLLHNKWQQSGRGKQIIKKCLRAKTFADLFAGQFCWILSIVQRRLQLASSNLVTSCLSYKKLATSRLKSSSLHYIRNITHHSEAHPRNDRGLMIHASGPTLYSKKNLFSAFWRNLHSFCWV